MRIARMAMQRSGKRAPRSYSYFIIIQLKRAMPASWILQTLLVLASAVFGPLFIAVHYPAVANDPRFVAPLVGCLSIYIAMSGVYLMMRSFRCNMSEIEMSTMVSTRRQLLAKLAILGMRDIAIFGAVIVAVKQTSQMRVATIAGCIMMPFLLANCIGLTLGHNAPSGSHPMRIATLGIALGLALLLAYSFAPNILNLFSSRAGGAICAALLLLCVIRIGKLNAKLSSMNPVAEVD